MAKSENAKTIITDGKTPLIIGDEESKEITLYAYIPKSLDKWIFIKTFLLQAFLWT